MPTKLFTAHVPELAQMSPQAALIHAGPRVKVQIHKRGVGAPHVIGNALIDTGAGFSAIALEAVVRLRLPIVGETPLITHVGSAMSQLYPFDLYFPDDEFPRVRIAGAVGSEHLARLGLVALLGRDALKSATFEYRGLEGKFRLTIPDGVKYRRDRSNVSARAQRSELIRDGPGVNQVRKTLGCP